MISCQGHGIRVHLQLYSGVCPWQDSREDGGAFPQLLFGAVGKLGLPALSRQAGVELLQALAPQSLEGPGSDGGPGQVALPEQLPPYDSPLKAFKGYRRAPAGVAVPARSTACLCYTLNPASQLSFVACAYQDDLTFRTK